MARKIFIAQAEYDQTARRHVWVRMHRSYLRGSAGYRKLHGAILSKLDELHRDGYEFQYASGKPLNAGYLSDQDFRGFLVDLNGRETGPGRHINTEKFATLDLYLRATDQLYYSAAEEVKRQRVATEYLFQNNSNDFNLAQHDSQWHTRVFLPNCMTLPPVDNLPPLYRGRIPIFFVSTLAALSHFRARMLFLPIDDQLLEPNSRAEWGLKKTGHYRYRNDTSHLELSGIITPYEVDAHGDGEYLSVISNSEQDAILSNAVFLLDMSHLSVGQKNLTVIYEGGTKTQFVSTLSRDGSDKLLKFLGFTAVLNKRL